MFTDRVSVGSNVIASVCLYVCLSVLLFSLCLWNRLTVDIELLHASR